MATTIGNMDNNKPLESSSIGNSSSLGKKEVSEGTVVQNVNEEEGENEITAIRRRLEMLSVEIADIENICRKKAGSGWKLVCSSRAVCDKLRQFNIVLEEISDEKQFIRNRLHELQEEMNAMQSALKYCEEQQSTERKVNRSGAAAAATDDAAAPPLVKTLDQDGMETELPVQHNEMERLNIVSSSHTISTTAAEEVTSADDDPVLTPIYHRRMSSKMKNHDDEERNKLKKGLIRAEKEMKYDYYFLKEVAEGEFKTALQRLSDLKYQAQETQEIIDDEREKLETAWDMIAFKERRNQDVQRRLNKWNSSNIDRLNKVMQSQRSSKAMWPEPSPQDLEISSSGNVNSNNEGGSVSASKELLSPPRHHNLGELKKAQKLAIDLTEENEFPALVV